METNSIISQIGNTPLVRLKQASELTGCNIYGKAEYFNPGESVKDRAALFIVEDAIKRKLISKGGTIVEGTAGNTGIGLGLVGNSMGFKTIIVMPETQSQEKKDALNFIPNNCSMDDKNSLWLMTGPNMAGKSTFLRQTAIIILMNQIGCFVPASSASLSIFDKIFTRIGASDNLAKGMSTFMMEMVETSRIINNASESSFVILDELGRGTSTQDGLAIAQSVLEHIFKKINCLTLFATHYKELCKITEHISEIKLKTLEIKRWKNEIIFLYKVVDGISEGSVGIHVAKLAGLKPI